MSDDEFENMITNVRVSRNGHGPMPGQVISLGARRALVTGVSEQGISIVRVTWWRQAMWWLKRFTRKHLKWICR